MISKPLSGFLTLFLTLICCRIAYGQSWTVKQARDLNHELNIQRHAVLSPNGEILAVMNRDHLILFDIDNGAERAVPWPRPLRVPLHTLSWSPDGRYIAFTEEFFRYMYEPDIWLFEVGDNSFRNLTDDGLTRGTEWLKGDSKAAVDVFPTWNPESGDLYFFRSLRQGDITTLALSTVDTNCVVRSVIELTDQVVATSVWSEPVWARKGRRLAVSIMSWDNKKTQIGIWLLDIQDGSVEKVAEDSDFQTGMPPWQQDRWFPLDIVWCNNDNSLVMSVVPNSGMFSGGAYNFHRVDLDTGVVTPLFDLNRFDTPEKWAMPGADGHSGMYTMPRSGAISHDGNWLFYTHFEGETPMKVSLSVLPITGGEPQILKEVSFEPVFRPPEYPEIHITTSGPGGRFLLPNHYIIVDME